MSEWRAGSDHDDEDELELLASPLTARKRLTKQEAQRLDDEAEYDSTPKARKPKAGERLTPESNDGSGKKRAGSGHSGSDHDGSVYERVQDWIAAKESTLGVVRPPQTGVDLVAGSGLTPDLTTQPWFISGATLHPHQMSALNWIKQRWELGVSCVLADEMGLGQGDDAAAAPRTGLPHWPALVGVAMLIFFALHCSFLLHRSCLQAKLCVPSPSWPISWSAHRRPRHRLVDPPRQSRASAMRNREWLRLRLPLLLPLLPHLLPPLLLPLLLVVASALS